MKITIEVSTDEIKELVALYRVRHIMIVQADFDTATLQDRIIERLLLVALDARGKEVVAEREK